MAQSVDLVLAAQKTDPTVELGTGNLGLVPWSAFYDAYEDVSDLAFPASVWVYNKMRNDSQIAALLLAFMLPIFGYRWYLDPNGASDEVVAHVANDFNVPIEGEDPQPTGRRRDRFSMGDYLYHSLLKMAFGFIFFEQVYRLGDDNKFHIRKLAPRMPGSIWQIQAARDGGLEYIRQYPQGNIWDPNRPSSFFGTADVGPFGYSQGPIIPVDRLIAHVNDKEGGNWYGRAYLRAIYKEWLLKDRVIRVDAMKHERNGMGVPTIEAPPNASRTQMEQLAALAQQYKSGEASGGALPSGAKLTLNGVSGTLPDSLATLKYYDEAMARRFLAMFTQLGSTQTGSRALGETFVDFFGMAQQSMAKSITDVTNEHAIEDLVDLNYSIDESAPLLCFKPESDRALATADLVALVNVGAITPDDTLEDWIRAEADLPEREAGDASAARPALAPGDAAAARGTRKPQARKRAVVVPIAAQKQREPNEIEQQSKADFTAIQATFTSSLNDLLGQWSEQIKPSQINELVAQIASTPADDFAAMANLSATPKGADIMTTAMHDLADTAADMAVTELTDQGAEITAPDLTSVYDVLAQRAGATEQLMANSIAQAASDHALSLAGGALTSPEIAVEVGDHLNSLTDAYPKNELGGSLMHAQNASRRAVFDTVPDKQIYASELADSPSCCENCVSVDGTEYDTMADAEKDYPVGGYFDCLGGYRCRGTLVAIYRPAQQ